MQLSLSYFLILRFYFTILIDVKMLLCDNGTIEFIFWGHSIAMVSLYEIAV